MTIARHFNAAAVQNLAEIRSGPANAKRPGVRQPSGALELGNGQSEFRRGNGARRNQMKADGARGSRTRLGDDGNQMGAHSALLAASKQLAAS
jgi:hypothetical protein